MSGSLPAATSYERGFRTRRLVVPEEIDELGHVNNAVYVRWLQDIAVEHWQRIATSEMTAQFIWVCHRHEIDYRLPLHEGEEAEVTTWVGEHHGARFDRHVDIRKSGAEKWSVRAKTTWVMLEKQTNKPKRISADILSTFGLSPSTGR